MIPTLLLIGIVVGAILTHRATLRLRDPNRALGPLVVLGAALSVSWGVAIGIADGSAATIAGGVALAALNAAVGTAAGTALGRLTARAAVARRSG